MPSTHVYYASSTYQHVLAVARAGVQSEATSYLVSSPSFDAMELIYALNNWSNSPFKRIYHIQSTSEYTRPDVWALQTKHRYLSKKLVETLQPAEVIVGKDNDVISQGLLHYSPETSTCICLEDGTAAYASSKFDPDAKWKQMLRKPLYGHWYSKPQVLGTSKWVDCFAATYPDLLRPELLDLSIEKLQPYFLHQIETSWLDWFIDQSGVSTKTIENLDTLIVLPHPNALSNEKDQIKTICKQILDELEDKKTLGLKYHPRDTQKSMMDSHKDSVVEIPQSIPAEVIYLKATDINTIIGVISTALLTARWLNDEVEVKSLAHTFNHENKQIVEVFDDIGIRIV